MHHLQQPISRPGMAVCEEPPSRVMTTRQAASFLGLAEKTLANWRVNGGGPRFLKYGQRSVRYRSADLLAFQEACIRTSTSESGRALTARTSHAEGPDGK